jgi:hypothetical protein
VFEFDAMQVHGDVDGGYGILAVEDFVSLAHVQEFDGEDVGGADEFFGSEEERGGFPLVDDPPSYGGGDAAKVGGGDGFEDDQDVEIGVVLVEVATGCGAVEKYGAEIAGGQFLEAVDEFA